MLREVGHDDRGSDPVDPGVDGGADGRRREGVAPGERGARDGVGPGGVELPRGEDGKGVDVREAAGVRSLERVALRRGARGSLAAVLTITHWVGTFLKKMRRAAG